MPQFNDFFLILNRVTLPLSWVECELFTHGQQARLLNNKITFDYEVPNTRHVLTFNF
jgi:hypothetical protein